MRLFTLVMRILALIPILTGALDLLVGLPALRTIGARLPPDAFLDPITNSHIRFVGAIWLGFGLFIILAVSDPTRYALLIKLALACIFLGGVGRLMSLAQFGIPTTPTGQVFVILVTALEIVGMPALLVWFTRLDGRRSRGPTSSYA